MQNRWQRHALAALATITLLGVGTVGRAELEGIALLAARQDVRTAVAKAVADGQLTRSEQLSIYREARDRLPPAEIQALKNQLVRLAHQHPPKPEQPTDWQTTFERATEPLANEVFVVREQVRKVTPYGKAVLAETKMLAERGRAKVSAGGPVDGDRSTVAGRPTLGNGYLLGLVTPQGERRPEPWSARIAQWRLRRKTSAKPSWSAGPSGSAPPQVVRWSPPVDPELPMPPPPPNDSSTAKAEGPSLEKTPPRGTAQKKPVAPQPNLLITSLPSIDRLPKFEDVRIEQPASLQKLELDQAPRLRPAIDPSARPAPLPESNRQDQNSVREPVSRVSLEAVTPPTSPEQPTARRMLQPESHGAWR
jgi:hypothetical protein